MSDAKKNAEAIDSTPTLKPMRTRLMAAMAAMPNPRKDTKAYNYKYETLDQVLSIVQPALMEQGLFVRQGVERTDDGWSLATYIVDAAGCDGDGFGEQRVDRRPLVFGDDQQRNGSYETYARRYALKTVFGLCGEDDDGAATAAKPEKTGKVPQQTETAPQKAPDGLAAAKRRMWAAMKAWGEKNGRTPEQVLEGVRKRPDWKETADFFNGIADEFEGAV